MAVAHPDLWAGAILISPGAGAFHFHYLENISTHAQNPDQIPLGTYLVYGELDGTHSVSMMGSVATRQLNPNSTISTMRWWSNITAKDVYGFLRSCHALSNGWNSAAIVAFEPSKISKCVPMRQGDRFFYWLEAPSISADLVGNPYQFDPKRFAQFNTRMLRLDSQRRLGQQIPSPDNKAIVWLTPEMVDFSRPMTFISSGRKSVQTLEPSIEVMLEDVRQRGDRQLFFWQRVIL